MKTVYIVRHAKSSWDNPSLPDFERPLNDRGKRDAPEMGRRLHKRGIMPDILLSSSAKRARSTAKRIARTLGIDEKHIRLADNLYHAEPEMILSTIQQLPDSVDNAMLFGHNPGLTDFVNKYINVHIDNIPTCGIVAAKFNVKSWKDINHVKGELVFFDFPKQTDD